MLALGMLTRMKRGFDLLAAHKGVALDLATIPAEDPRTYAMIRKADTLGVFQIESRAQMSMLPRLKPRTYYDLVVQVAIVRPARSRATWSTLSSPPGGQGAGALSEARAEAVLGKTLGVPLFQEQAMRVAIECAGFTPGEAGSAPPKVDGDLQVHRRRLRSSRSSSPGWWRTATSRRSPRRPSDSSKASAAMAFPRAMPRPSR